MQNIKTEINRWGSNREYKRSVLKKTAAEPQQMWCVCYFFVGLRCMVWLSKMDGLRWKSDGCD
jgi:hypothetical protein